MGGDVVSAPVIISLCDYTGHMVEPWTAAGYDAVLVDPQHGLAGDITTEGNVTTIANTVLGAMPYLGELIRTRDIAFVAAFPPCTDMAVSGARWFGEKAARDPLFQARAIAVAEQCRAVGQLSGAPWFVENPVSILSSAWGEPQHKFHPYFYAHLEPDDNYTKLTCLWTGGGFRMPSVRRPVGFTPLGPPDDRIHKAPPGPDRANFRSATPRGFARAVFAANARAVAA
jgi:hypothetical protein